MWMIMVEMKRKAIMCAKDLQERLIMQFPIHTFFLKNLLKIMLTKTNGPTYPHNIKCLQTQIYFWNNPAFGSLEPYSVNGAIEIESNFLNLFIFYLFIVLIFLYLFVHLFIYFYLFVHFLIYFYLFIFFIFIYFYLFMYFYLFIVCLLIYFLYVCIYFVFFIYLFFGGLLSFLILIFIFIFISVLWLVIVVLHLDYFR